MTFDDDFVRLHLSVGPVTLTCKDLGLEWPPPERLWFDRKVTRAATDDDAWDEVLVCARRSALTDEEREGMSHVARGAEYFYTDEAATGP